MIGEQSFVRPVAAYLMVNGMPFLCLSASVSKSSTRTADTFTAALSLTYTAQMGMDEAAWSELDSAEAEVVFVAGASRSLISGEIDDISIDFIDRIITVKGRDKSAKLSEKRRSKKYNNQKSTDIVSEIAGDNGLSPVIETSDDDAGKIYTQDTVHHQLNKTDYETLTELAEREGARWYVTGDELHFVPKDSAGGVYEVFYDNSVYEISNAIKITATRNMKAAKSAKVKVKSFHNKDNKDYEGNAESSGSGSGTLEYSFTYPMMNQQQVDKIAKSKLKDAIRHEMNLSIDMPGDLDIFDAQKLSLSGTGSAFDQTYNIDKVEFKIGEDGGFEMSISTKAPKSGRSGSDE